MERREKEWTSTKREAKEEEEEENMTICMRVSKLIPNREKRQGNNRDEKCPCMHVIRVRV